MAGKPPEHVWIMADIPREVNEEFALRAKQHHRAARAQLRAVIEEFLERCRQADAQRAERDGVAA